MPATTIVSYDGTDNDADALTLARVLGEAGARLVLAYVLHGARAPDVDAARKLLRRGAEILDQPGTETRLIAHPSTSEGLRQLAAREAAQLIVFGSAYRTPLGRVAPQTSTQRLLDGGTTAIAIAPAAYDAREIHTIGLLAELDDVAAIDTAHALASHYAAVVTDHGHGVDLLIVGSRPQARTGTTLLCAQTESAIFEATAPVLVTTRGVALDFHTELYLA